MVGPPTKADIIMRKPTGFLIPTLFGVSSIFWGCTASSDAPTQSDHAAFVRENYSKTEQLVSMRDGAQLFTIVYTPRDTSQTYPIMLLRTPYSVGPYGLDEYKEQLGPSPKREVSGGISRRRGRPQ